MSKKDAYKLVNYLLDEAIGILDYSDFTDIKAVSNLLATANYISKSFQLKEHQEIICRIHNIRKQAYQYLRMSEESLENIFE